MNKSVCISFFVFFIVIFFSFNNLNKNIYCINSYAEEISVLDDKRACWVSFLDIEEFLIDLDEYSYRDRIGKMFDNILANNMNTVIFHVRPMGDAIYPSNIFPWSVYITSERNAPGYDPLLVAIEEAHRRGLYFEAWINPYRLSKNNDTTALFKTTEFYEFHKDIIIEYVNIDGEVCLSLNPSHEESKRLICNGVAEIVDNYDVDGIHFDDYFYMNGMDDELSVSDKMKNVDDMIASVYKIIKDNKPNCQFGISPAGNMENAKRDGADIDKWLSEDGYVDYIMPQLYWTDDFINSDGEEISLFSKRCEEWQSVNKLKKPIYAGLALYKVGEESASDTGWNNYDDNLKKQCDKAYQMGYNGYALFRYAWLEYDSSLDELKNLNAYVETLSFSGIYDNSNNVSLDVLNKTSSNETYLKTVDIQTNNDKLICVTYCKGLCNKYLVVDGCRSGINKLFKGISSIAIAYSDEELYGGVEYRVHICNGVWSPWAKDGEPTINNTGEDYSDNKYSFNGYTPALVDGVEIKLYGDLALKYDLFYRVEYFDKSCTSWKSDGDIAGDIGIRGAVSCIDIRLIKK